MEWSWTTWAISVAAVVLSAAIAWSEGNWRRRPGLAMGFANHGGMWSDLVLLPMANAAIVPHLTMGLWIVGAGILGTLASIAAHIHWYHPAYASDAASVVEPPRGDHMWPSHRTGIWWGDLSWSGWAHVIYVAGELALLFGFVLHTIPTETVVFVAAIFTIHVPIGLLQPRWYRTGHLATIAEQPLLAPLLLALWAMTYVKL